MRVAVAIVVMLPLWRAVNTTLTGSYRDHADVFDDMMIGPITLVFPLVVVLLTCLPLYHELAARNIANTRTRIDIRLYIARQIAVSGLLAAAIFFVDTFLAFVVAFYLWPILGDPSVDPAGYGLTPETSALDSLTRSSYSFLLASGDLVYGGSYSAWVGFSGAVYSILGICFLVTVPNRILALSLPFLIYIGATLTAQLAGQPHLGLDAAVFPQGLEAADPLYSATPMLIVAGATAVLATIVICRARTNSRLA